MVGDIDWMIRLLGSMDLVWGAIVCGRSVLDAAGLLAKTYGRQGIEDIPMRVVS
jgi:hypothetical protein